MTAGRLHWEIIIICFHRKAALLLSNDILFHVLSYLHMYFCIYFMRKGILLWNLFGFSNLLIYTKDTKMREVTNEEFLAQFFSSCFVKTVMQHPQNSSPQKSLPGCKIPHVQKEFRNKTQICYIQASAEKEPYGVKSCAVSLGLLWVRAVTRGAARNRTLQQGRVCAVVLPDHKLESTSRCLNVQ